MPDEKINTVSGRIKLADTGYILAHEHVVYFPLVVDPGSFEAIRSRFIPMYQDLVRYGCKTIVELTPRLISDAFGSCRYPDGYRRNTLGLYGEICRATGMNLVLCTGFYREHTRPAYFFENSVSALADEMIRDIADGIDGSGVKAGIIKIAVDSMASAADRKLLAAAAIAQKATGVSVSTHTCSSEVRFGTLNFLEGAGVDPARIYLGHADTNADIGEALALARRGCSLILTIWGITDEATIGWNHGALAKSHSACFARALADDGHIGRLLASVDYCATCIDGKLDDYRYGVPDRDSRYAFTFILPELRGIGLTNGQIETVMRENPRRMLAVHNI